MNAIKKCFLIGLLLLSVSLFGARATLTATDVGTSLTSLAITGADGTVGTADGIDFINNGNTFLILHNADAAQHTATIVAQGNSFGADFADETITIAAGKTHIIGPFNKGAFNIAAKVQVDYEVGEHDHFYAKVIAINRL
jgi:hypothetical protein